MPSHEHLRLAPSKKFWRLIFLVQEAIKQLEMIQYAQSGEYKMRLHGLEELMGFAQGEQCKTLQDEYINLVTQYGACTERSRLLAQRLANNGQCDILQTTAPYLDKGILQPQVADKPCTEGETDMAQRHKISYTLPDGEKVFFTGDTMADVITNALKRYGNTVSSPRKNIPVLRDYMPRFHSTYKNKLRDNTKAAYEHLTRNHIYPKLGDKPLDEITTADIQELYDSMVDQGLSRETILKARNVLRPCLGSAVEDGLIERNPFDSKRLRINTDKGTHHKAIPVDVMQAIKDDLQNLPENERRMMALLCYSGMRIGEILGLRWEDIDFENARLKVERGVTHPARNKPVVGPPKTKCSIREVILFNRLGEALSPHGTTGYIIGDDQPLTFQQDKRLWEKIRKRYNLDGYSRHDFRATCATVWKEQGMDIQTIQAMLGHEDMSTTAKFYTKVRDDSYEKAKEIMDASGF